MTFKNTLNTIIILSIFFPISIYAEVMDKEASLQEICIWGIVGAILILLSIRFTPIVSPIIISIFGIYFYGLYYEINSFDVGPAILQEVGIEYFYVSYAMMFLLTVSFIFGIIWRKLAFRKEKVMNGN
jgi:hypothetical protein